MSNIDSLSKRLERVAGTLPEQDDRLIAHLTDWQKETLAMGVARRTLYKKLELIETRESITEEEYNAAIAEAGKRTPEEEAASRWFHKKYEGKYEGAKEILLHKLESTLQAQAGKDESAI